MTDVLKRDEHGELIPTEGWVFASNFRKAHYVRAGKSLCGKWAYLGKDFDGDDAGGPADCAACKKKRAAELSANPSGEPS